MRVCVMRGASFPGVRSELFFFTEKEPEPGSETLRARARERNFFFRKERKARSPASVAGAPISLCDLRSGETTR
jgi:hypothetical protein